MAKIYNFHSQIKLILLLLLIFFGCKNESGKSSVGVVDIKKSLTEISDNSLEKSVVKTFRYRDYVLTIESRLCTDTLEVNDYKEDRYSSPIILSQRLFFFKKAKLLKEYTPPIKSIIHQTIRKNKLNILETPIYEICKNNTFYVVNGGIFDICFGVECPEFLGIYSMDGKIIYEGCTNTKEKMSLDKILTKYKIRLNNDTSCIQVDKF